MNGKKLKSILEERGIKQKWVADKLGISSAMVNQWVTGDRPISNEREKELKKLFPN